MSQFDYTYDAKGQIASWKRTFGTAAATRYDMENDPAGQLTGAVLILASDINPQCLALSAAVVGQLVKHMRPASKKGTTHTDSHPRREYSRYRDSNWKAVPGISRKTAWYWRVTRKDDFERAKGWLWSLLKNNGFVACFDPDEALVAGTQQRDDLSRILEGKTVRISRYDPTFSSVTPRYSLKRGRHKAAPQPKASS